MILVSILLIVRLTSFLNCLYITVQEVKNKFISLWWVNHLYFYALGVTYIKWWWIHLFISAVLSAGLTCSQNPKGFSSPYNHELKIFLMHDHICWHWRKYELSMWYSVIHLIASSTLDMTSVANKFSFWKLFLGF